MSETVRTGTTGEIIDGCEPIAMGPFLAHFSTVTKEIQLRVDGADFLTIWVGAAPFLHLPAMSRHKLVIPLGEGEDPLNAIVHRFTAETMRQLCIVLGRDNLAHCITSHAVNGAFDEIRARYLRARGRGLHEGPAVSSAVAEGYVEL